MVNPQKADEVQQTSANTPVAPSVRAVLARRAGLIRVLEIVAGGGTIGIIAAALIGVAAQKSGAENEETIRVLLNDKRELVAANQSLKKRLEQSDSERAAAKECVPDQQQVCDRAVREFRDCEKDTYYTTTMEQCQEVRKKLMNAACASLIVPTAAR